MAADRAVSAGAEPPRAPTVLVAAGDRERNLLRDALRAALAERLSAVADHISLVFHAWREAGLFERINHGLVMADRERTGREASPTGAIIDSQSVKTTESGGPRGYDAGKKVKGRKRHALVDTDGRPLVIRVHEASIQDRDGAVPVLVASRRSFPFVEIVFTDSGLTGGRRRKHVIS
jgi:transposase